MFRSTAFRQAALYTVVFSISAVVLAFVMVFAIRTALSAQFDNRIQSEMAALTQEYETEGLEGVVQAVREHDLTPGAISYGLEGPDRQTVAGRLGATQAPPGWSMSQIGGTKGLHMRVLADDLPGGYRLIVGDDVERIEALDGVVLKGFAWALAVAVLIGGAGGVWLGRDLHRRLSAISQTAGAIAEGDLTRRAPVRGSGDDLDNLAVAFNAMLDRIATLMESIKQVSSDIAHDLRTPLARLRQRLEAGLAKPDASARGEAIEGALDDLDITLRTFAALLRITQIDSGSRRAGFQTTDLALVARSVAEAMSPSAEEDGRNLVVESPQAVMVMGDAELLSQLLVNLVENGLQHTPPGTTIRIETGLEDERPFVAVSDNGPGVPLEDRERVLDRFVRLERSRSTPGHGLGLALAQSVAKLHGGACVLQDARPGLRVMIVLPAGPST